MIEEILDQNEKEPTNDITDEDKIFLKDIFKKDIN